MPATPPIIIAHRGACGYLPEHTLAAYAVAYAMGADFLEPDLIATRDGELICCHDIHLDRTTDVAQCFPDRARSDGRWYAADFTLAEIRTLQACERFGDDGARVFPGRFAAGASGFAVPTFEELLRLVASLNRQSGRQVGVYPETKDPAFHIDQGLAIEPPLLALLARYGYQGRAAAVFIQSFSADNLQMMRFEMGCTLPMIQLIEAGEEHDHRVTDAGLDAIARYADGIGPDKQRITETQGALVAGAHARGLQVHPWTFRADALGPGFSSLAGEIRAFADHGVDGVFTDFADAAVAIVRPDSRQPLVSSG